MSDDARWVGSMPEVYDRLLGPALFAPFAARVAAAALELAPKSVLELAAGTGVGTLALVQALPDARIVATDLNPAMVTWAAQRIRGATWQQADAQDLDLPDASFDLVVCQFGVMFFSDKRAAYSEAARAMTREGTLLLTVWDTVEVSEFPRALMESLAAVFPDGPPGFIAEVPHGYADTSLIESDLRVAGLTRISIERLTLGGTATSAAALAEGYCMGTPLRFALEKRGSLGELTRAVGVEMTARLGEGEVAGDLVAFIVSAHKPR